MTVGISFTALEKVHPFCILVLELVGHANLTVIYCFTVNLVSLIN